MVVEARRPVHLAILAGLSASAYALALAGVTTMQSASDHALIETRAPVSAAVERLGSAHDALDDVMSSAARTYLDEASRYQRLSARMLDVEAALDVLAGQVSKVAGAVDDLPTRVQLPRVTISTPRMSKPVVHATTGASG